VNPWVRKNFKEFNDYFSVLGKIIAESDEIVNVGVMHPLRSSYLNYKRMEEGHCIMDLEIPFEKLLKDLVAKQLPHHLIDAFRSTLEEAKYADIILHVVDASNPDCYKHMHVVYETLRNLGVEDKKVITIFNKQDIYRQKVADGEMENEVRKDLKADETVCGSVKTETGLEKLVAVLEKIVSEQNILIEGIIPYAQAGKVQLIRQYGQLLQEEYVEEGIAIKAYVPKELEGKFK
jgi:GTP-binding protein HflX